MSIIYEEKTEYGTITVTEMALRKLVDSVIEEHKGRVYLTNSKGKRMNKVYKSVRGDQASDVQVSVHGGRVSICVYIIIKFGMSIHDTTEKLIEELRLAYKHVTGKNPWKIKVVITGVMSKKLAKRNVEVEKIYD